MGTGQSFFEMSECENLVGLFKTTHQPKDAGRRMVIAYEDFKRQRIKGEKLYLFIHLI
jgi:hypothetical protein